MAKTSRQQTLAGFDEPEIGNKPSVQEPVLAVCPPPPGEDPSLARRASEDDVAGGDLAGRSVYIVDSHSLIYQVFHGMPEMTGPTGQPVGAVQGFMRDLVDLIENRKADLLICAFDHPGENFRHEIFPAYKQHREEMPADLQLQIPMIHRFLEALNIPVLSIPGYEADDVLATMGRLVSEAGGAAYLVTGDKDARQLISERVKVFNIRKNEVFDEVALKATWGIRPDQVIDFQTLVGDSVDGIPGVPQIGPKTAQELLSKFETLEGIYEHTAEISGTKRRENIIAGKEQALISRQLVRLDTHVPLEIDWGSARIGRFKIDDVEALCRECGFRQIATRLAAMGKRLPTSESLPVVPRVSRDDMVPESDVTVEAEEGASATTGEASRFEEASWIATYKTIATEAELRELVATMSQQKRLVLDTETTSIQPRWAEIVGYSFCFQPGEAYYVPVRAPAGDPQIDPKIAIEILRPVLENPAIEKVGQNIKYDMVVLRTAGVELQGASFDTMVADYLLDPGERTHGLDDLARRYLRHTNISIKSLIGSGKNQKKMEDVPVPLITAYAAEDADVPLRLLEILEPRLAEQGLAELFTGLEIPLIEVLADLEFNGIRVDGARLRQLDSEFVTRIADLEKEIYAIAGGEFNIDSRIQLAKLLFDTLGLPITKRTKTGPAMDAEVLEDMAKLHPLPAKILEYRQNTKLKSTYVDSLQELIHPQTGRVHTSFKQDVAATGRLSSQDPNLQNIPIRTEQGRAIRSAFLPGPPGWRLMTADYSQIELRVMAHFSGDAALKKAFDEDRDIHTQVASEVYGVPLADVTKAMRRSAKAINFGVIYGQSPFGLAKSIDISKSDAAKFIDAYFAGYPGVDEFMRQTLIQCRKQGYVSTISGRRRPVSGVRDPDSLQDKRQRNLPERIAINTVIQGSAADIIKRAMINLHRRLKEEKLQAKMLLQIHDELVFEFPPEEQDQLTKMVVQEMSGAAKLVVPLKIDVKTGLNWAECEPIA
ncbi:MAG: DNA polymerase I [Pirellulaceae bacterium]